MRAAPGSVARISAPASRSLGISALLLFASTTACWAAPLGLAIGAAAAENRTNHFESAQRHEAMRRRVETELGTVNAPCPCHPALHCVHVERLERGVCRPTCSLDDDRCPDGTPCTAVTGGPPACLDRRIFGENPRSETYEEPPAPLDG